MHGCSGWPEVGRAATLLPCRSSTTPPAAIAFRAPAAASRTGRCMRQGCGGVATSCCGWTRRLSRAGRHRSGAAQVGSRCIPSWPSTSCRPCGSCSTWPCDRPRRSAGAYCACSGWRCPSQTAACSAAAARRSQDASHVFRPVLGRYAWCWTARGWSCSDKASGMPRSTGGHAGLQSASRAAPPGDRLRRWRKLHLAVDADTGEIAAHALTEGHADDAAQVPTLLGQVEGVIASVTADGAYDGEPTCAAAAARQRPVPPVRPPSTAPSLRIPAARWRAGRRRAPSARARCPAGPSWTGRAGRCG